MTDTATESSTATMEPPDQPQPDAAPAPDPAKLQSEIDMLREHDRAVREQADEVARLESIYEEKKDAASAAKKLWELAATELVKLCRERPTPGPLFDAGAGAATDTPSAPDAQQGQPGAENVAWRDVPITELLSHGVKASTRDKLVEVEITTLGELSDAMSAGHTWNEGIAGVGEKAREAIELAMPKWFAANPDKCGPVSEPSQAWRAIDTAPVFKDHIADLLAANNLTTFGAIADHALGDGYLESLGLDADDAEAVRVAVRQKMVEAGVQA